MAQNNFFYLDKAGLSQYDGLIKQYIGADENCKIYYGTTAEWAAQSQLISQQNSIYVYTDHSQEEQSNETIYIPGIKIGDGNSYLIDRPFITKPYDDHIANLSIHVTSEDKTSWNNKVTCYINNTNPTRLIFSKD